MAEIQEQNDVEMITDSSEVLSRREAERELKRLGALSVPQFEKGKVTGLHIYAQDGRLLEVGAEQGNPVITKDIISLLEQPYQAETLEYLEAEEVGKDLARVLSNKTTHTRYTAEEIETDNPNKTYVGLYPVLNGEPTNTPEYVVSTDDTQLKLTSIPVLSDPQNYSTEALVATGHTVAFNPGGTLSNEQGKTMAGGLLTIVRGINETKRIEIAQLRGELANGFRPSEESVKFNGLTKHDQERFISHVAQMANYVFESSGHGDQMKFYVKTGRPAEYIISNQTDKDVIRVQTRFDGTLDVSSRATGHTKLPIQDGKIDMAAIMRVFGKEIDRQRGLVQEQAHEQAPVEKQQEVQAQKAPVKKAQQKVVVQEPVEPIKTEKMAREQPVVHKQQSAATQEQNPEQQIIKTPIEPAKTERPVQHEQSEVFDNGTHTKPANIAPGKVDPDRHLMPLTKEEQEKERVINDAKFLLCSLKENQDKKAMYERQADNTQFEINMLEDMLSRAGLFSRHTYKREIADGQKELAEEQRSVKYYDALIIEDKRKLVACAAKLGIDINHIEEEVKKWDDIRKPRSLSDMMNKIEQAKEEREKVPSKEKAGMELG